MKKQLSNRLLIEKTLNVNKYAVISNGSLTFIEIMNKNLPKKDEIYLGKIEKYNKTMKAAFVDIGSHKVFVPSNQDLIEGETILVQILKSPEKSKLAKGTLDISIGGEYAVILMNGTGIKSSNKSKNNPKTIQLIGELSKDEYKQLGILLRSKSTVEHLEQVQYEIQKVKDIIANFSGEIGLKYSPFNEIVYIENQVERFDITEIVCNDMDTIHLMKSKKLHLKMDIKLDKVFLFNRNAVIIEEFLNPEFKFNNFKLTINYLEALCVIDVDASFINKTSLREVQIRKINEQAFDEILKIIDIYKIAGIIMIDFITMNQRNTSEFQDFMTNRINNCTNGLIMRAHPLIHSGLAQLVIEKKYNSIVTTISKQCPHCNGSGLALNDEMKLDQFEIDLQSKIDNSQKYHYKVQIPMSFEQKHINRLLEIASNYKAEIELEECNINKIIII